MPSLLMFRLPPRVARSLPRLHRTAAQAAAWLTAALFLGSAHGQAAAPRAPVKPSEKAPAAAQASPKSVGKTATGPLDYRVSKTPEWVKPLAVPASSTATPPATPVGYRFQLLDSQTLIGTDGSQQVYTRSRSSATDSAGLATVSKAELYFNPAFQTLTVHEAAVFRNGQRLDRLKDARIEMLRREEGLERLTLTGLRTLLIVMNDVRVGDEVEVAYTVQGSNPIFKGHVSQTFQLAHLAPVELLQTRIEYPIGRILQARGIRSDAVPERFTEGGRQVMRVLRQNVAAIVPEENVPPWYKVFPALQVSDFDDWHGVAAWAEELFARPGELGPELSARIEAWRARQLPPEQLVSEVLSFVQDEVRYFSMSLGESSHRPKAPSRTYAERLGDCKDKVALLNAMLGALGFDVKPALISVYRNRGLANYLPSHDQFDHVITRLALGGQVYWLDGTLQKQGLQLKSRGTVPYGLTLVVDAQTTGLTKVEPPAGSVDGLEFDQRWDTADLSRPVQFSSVVRARGLSAEGWRNSVAGGGTDRIATHLAGLYARVMPGIRAVGAPELRDDRERNVFELELKYEMPSFGQYERGTLQVEVPALEILDSLVGPREARRDMPYLVDQPVQVTQRVRIVAPRRFNSQPPGPSEIGDEHFSLGTRYELDGATLTYVMTYQRRSDEVLPDNLASYRDRIQSARKLAGVSVRLPLFDFASLREAFSEIDQRVQRTLGQQSDALRDIVVRQEVERLLATETLKRTGEQGTLAGSVLNQRAIASSLLGDPQATLADAERVIAVAPSIGYAHYTRGLALLSLGRPDEALAAMRQYKNPDNRALLDRGIGRAQYYGGQFADAERSFQAAVQASSGDDRLFALSWLYLAAERHGGKGKDAIAPYLDSVDRSAWPGVVVHYLAGRATQDEVLRQARSDKRMERLNLTEAYFYLGQQALLSGRSDDARRMFQRTVELNATPYLEHTDARMELKKDSAR